LAALEDAVTVASVMQQAMNPKLLPLAGLVIVLVGLTGCAGTGSSHTRDMLSTAGFREIKPETPKQLELYAAAPSYKMHQITAKGKTFYAYKDEKRGTAFIGDEIKFRQYQRLLMQENAQQQQVQAAMMQPQVAVGWYGAYGGYLGPRYGYGPYVGPRYGAIGRFR
jgi:hypothetical protein